MFNVKNHKQLHIFLPLGLPGAQETKRTRWLMGWSILRDILPNLLVESFRKHYHDWNGRPTKELHAMIGLMILQ